MFGIGGAEMGVMLMFFAGFGLPLGLPPEAENPTLAYVAPEQPLLYASWAGMAEPKPGSNNQTEQLLAEPDVREFAAQLERGIGLLVSSQAGPGERGDTIRRAVPLILQTVMTRGTAAFITKLQPQGETLEVEGGALLHAGENAAAVADGILKLSGLSGAEVKDAAIPGGKFSRITPNKEVTPSTITVGAMGPYVLIGIGEGSVEGMIARVRAKKTPAWLTAIGEHLPVERRATVSYVNLNALLKTFLPMGGPDAARMANLLGLNGIGVMEGVSGLNKDGLVRKSLITLDPNPKGLLKMLDGGNITPASLRGIPEDVVASGAVAVNAGRVYDAVFETVAEAQPGAEEDMKQAAEQFQQMFGMALREELLASLGDTWTFHMAPADGWLVGLTASVGVTDRTKLDALNLKLQELLRQMQPDEDQPWNRPPQIVTSKRGADTIYTLRIPEVPVQPSWCVTDDRVIFGPYPQAVKSALAVGAETKSIVDRPEWGELLQDGDPILSAGFQDSAKSFEMTYTYAAILLPAMSQFMRQEPGAPAIELPSLPPARTIHRHLRPTVSVTRRNKLGLESETRQTYPSLDVGTTAPVAVALLLPAVQAARQAARRVQSTNNLKQIMLGIHNFHDTHNGMPPQFIPDKTGKPGLSWRVAILPYVEAHNVYNQFKLDEPWDSEHNKKLIPLMPKVYQCPSANVQAGKTVYLGIAGPGGGFQPPKFAPDNPLMWRPGNSFAFILDGMSNTAAVLEASNANAVIWTKPDDYIPDEKAPLKGVADYNGGNVFQVGLWDGSVRAITKSVDPKMLWRLYQCQDGEVLTLP